MESLDADTLQCYLVGNYVYSVYKKKTGGIKIDGDENTFYYVLGWNVKQAYPESYDYIVDRLK